ncbi:hypothetical protein GPECTOR_5g181 [Gonium pectorale]|uniref:Cas1p 10 TM acyl transferase domain-containing protein n=1 Tax=Gonium pectorale TaxID=33097 RepID=A0A150GWB1_GONPE|nr:hypothetical protein GPECTOR_5g181 [Gonium pectorale]|eukprot:KXZ54075.1 hypothetical protein GPECTOR_5g181 [Gonium pectorale]
MLTAPISAGQVSFFVAFIWSFFAWIYAEVLHRQKSTRNTHDSDDDPEAAKLLHANGGGSAAAVAKEGKDSGGGGAGEHAATGGKPEPVYPPHSFGPHSGILESMANSGLVACLQLKPSALLQHRHVLRSTVEFGLLMLWYFIADRTTIIGEGPKDYSRDLFLFLFVILTCVAAGSSLQAFKMPLLLNRPQTEEWKGWMQVLFLLYHYFEAKEAYSAIRIFIAAYVWMTGFGNFSYYYKTGDFCIGRFAQMLWRLNFLVFFCCVVLRNSYMLYYICPMHTIYTVFVYVALAVAPQLNQNNIALLVKIFLCFVFIFITWDLQRVFYAIWTPFLWLVGYNDPRKPTEDLLHEWYFRSSLDRYIWIYGMLCAYMHPWAASVLKAIDEMPAIKRFTVRSVILSACGVIGWYYYIHIYCLEKYDYNAIHPYTSWIPITLWIVVRNITPTLRIYNLRLYGWLGCITLETYISQFHVWMKTDIPDGQPKSLLVLLPGYPLLNFALVTGLYVLVSHRLFDLTNALKNSAVPHSNNSLLLRNVIMMAVTGAALYGMVAVMYNLGMGGALT